jgi:predicted secreted protein
MTPVGGLVSFLIIWWVVLFAVLPWGVRAQWEEGETVRGTEPGAPVAPNLWRKAIWTTLIAAALWAALYGAVELGVIPPNLLAPSAPR